MAAAWGGGTLRTGGAQRGKCTHVRGNTGRWGKYVAYVKVLVGLIVKFCFFFSVPDLDILSSVLLILVSSHLLVV